MKWNLLATTNISQNISTQQNASENQQSQVEDARRKEIMIHGLQGVVGQLFHPLSSHNRPWMFDVVVFWIRTFLLHRQLLWRPYLTTDLFLNEDKAGLEPRTYPNQGIGDIAFGQAATCRGSSQRDCDVNQVNLGAFDHFEFSRFCFRLDFCSKSRLLPSSFRLKVTKDPMQQQQQQQQSHRRRSPET